MFFERVPIHPLFGTTPSQIFNLYGIPPRRDDALHYVMALPQNQALRQSIQGPIGLDTNLLQASRSQVPGGDTLCLPIDFGVVHSIVPDFNVTGVQPRGHMLKPIMTHAVHVRFHLTFGNTPWRGAGDAFRCKRIRWVQTVSKKNNPYPGPDIFVDGGGTEHELHGGEGDLMDVPWYDHGEGYYDKLSGQVVERLELTDTAGGPEAKTLTSGLYFAATTSAAVWTGKRVTLIQSFSWNFRILPGKDKRSVQHSAILPATSGEIREHLRILKDIHQNNICTNRPRQPPLCLQTGGDLNYRPTPANGSINEGM
jgi:hypothetical protein